ncbi:MAG: 3-isopropylmalate dehydratase small subunit [Candidatus Dormibacteria bacterium]
MTPFVCEHGTVVPIDRADVDTDQLIPKQFLRRTERSGYGPFLFFDMRYTAEGAERDDFVLNQPAYRNASVMVTRRNFGCGSSREHAVWALQDFGIRAVIAPSFADIFTANAHACGLLPVVLAEHEIDALIDLATEEPGLQAVVDLEECTVRAGDLRFSFDVDPSVRRRLLEGLDDIGATLQQIDHIDAHEARRPRWMPRLPAEATP